MKKYTLLILLAIFTASAISAKESSPRFWLGPIAGYSNGFGGGAELTLMKLTPAFPLSLHFSATYFYQFDPGVAIDARKIFINDATGGNDNIFEYGSNVFLRLDFSYPLYNKKGIILNAFLGIANARHLAHFDYQGGNEAFDVTTNPFGFGLGVRGYLFVSKSIILNLTAGLEYFLPDRITAHGNFYNPNGQDDNPRNDYTYASADNAIYQPTFNPRILVSLGFRL
jgi:hypothetical protein